MLIMLDDPQVYAAVHCDLLSTLTVKKDVFLRDKQNKQRFINMLSEKLKEVRFDTIHGAGDADILIAQTAVSVLLLETASSSIADDTDILNLLCHHGNNSNKKLFFKPEPKRGVRARQGLPGHPSYFFCTRVKPLQTSPVSTRAAVM
ncbi:hypothetical protein ACROYT_G029879 [Oculina patagonica]